MGYQLGIDLGTTWTAAAILREGQVSMVELSQRSTAVPSVVLLREDSILVGETAERRAPAEPSRVAREFKRRIGDSTPLLLGGTPFSAEAVTARLLGWVVDEATRQEGGPPYQLVLTHPANWGEYKLDLLRQAVILAGINIPIRLISEPEAAVIHYASKERVEPGALIGTYDLGGGTFDAAVLRKTDEGFEFLGQRAGIERLGGIDFDEAVFQRVISSLGIDLTEMDGDDQALENAMHRLRAECVVAKEILSTDTDTSIPVMLPSVQTEVRLTRAEFESMIRPTLADTITVTERVFDSAGVGIEAIDRILLVGGSSRIPVVSELLATRFGRPLAVDAHPKNSVALGAALSAADGRATESLVATESPAAAPVVPAAEPSVPVASEAALTEELRLDTTAPTTPQSASRKPLMIGALIAALIALGVVAVFALSGGDESGAATLADPVAEDDPTQATFVAPTVAATTALTPTVLPTEVAAPPIVLTTAPTPTVLPTEVAAAPIVLPTPTVAPVDDSFYEGVRCEMVQGLCIDITNVGLQDGELLIGWDANFVPNIADRNHAHFFWSTFSPLQAGAGGGGGDWEVSDSQPHLAGTNGNAVTTARRPAGANICVTVANPDHTVRDPAIYQCWEYPSLDGTG